MCLHVENITSSFCFLSLSLSFSCWSEIVVARGPRTFMPAEVNLFLVNLLRDVIWVVRPDILENILSNQTGLAMIQLISQHNTFINPKMEFISQWIPPDSVSATFPAYSRVALEESK